MIRFEFLFYGRERTRRRLQIHLRQDHIHKYLLPRLAPNYGAPSFESTLNRKRCTHQMVTHLIRYFMGERGLEPPQIALLVPKTSAYTNSATRP